MRQVLFSGLREYGADQNDLLVALGQAQSPGVDPFVVTERSGQHYMQCLCQIEGWLLEKREGCEQKHFRAVAPIEQSQPAPEPASLMTQIVSPQRQRSLNLQFDHVVAAMTCYLSHKQEPDWLQWERIEL